MRSRAWLRLMGLQRCLKQGYAGSLHGSWSDVPRGARRKTAVRFAADRMAGAVCGENRDGRMYIPGEARHAGSAFLSAALRLSPDIFIIDTYITTKRIIMQDHRISSNQNVLPWPRRLSTPYLAACMSRIPFTIESPSPVPALSRTCSLAL